MGLLIDHAASRPILDVAEASPFHLTHARGSPRSRWLNLSTSSHSERASYLSLSLFFIRSSERGYNGTEACILIYKSGGPSMGIWFRSVPPPIPPSFSLSPSSYLPSPFSPTLLGMRSNSPAVIG